jgi:hypothetical protein
MVEVEKSSPEVQVLKYEANMFEFEMDEHEREVAGGRSQT